MAVRKVSKTQLSKVNVDSTIDMRINKSDIIELMMEEEESKLEAAVKTAENHLDEMRETETQKVFEKFKKDNADFVANIEKEFGGTFKRSETSHDSYVYLYIDNKPVGTGCCGRSAISISIKFSVEALKKFQELRDIHNEAQRKRCDFSHNNKKYRAALTRQMLQNSEEGQAILQKIKDVKAVVVLPEGK